MNEILQKMNQELKKIDSEVKDQENKIAQDKKIIEQRAKEAASLESRLATAKSDKQNIQNEYESKREARQNAIFEGKDITAINSELNKIKESLEIKDDEVISIQNKLDAVNTEMAKATESINNAELSLKGLLRKKEAYQVCINYNQAAEPFAKALQAYYEFLKKDEENSRLFVFGSDYTGRMTKIDIEKVAKLYVPEYQAIFHVFDEVPMAGLEGSTIKTNVKNYPETWNWFSKNQ